MFHPRHPSRFRRSVAGLALIGAPLAFGIADTLRLVVEGAARSEAEQLVAIGAQASLWQLAGLLNLLGVILFVPAVMGLMHVLRARGSVLSHVGGALALVGLLGWAAHWARYFGFMGAASTTGVDHGEILAMMEGWMAMPDTLIYVLMFLLASFLGMLLLGIGVLRARVSPRPAAIIFLVGWLGWFVTSFTPFAESPVVVAAAWTIITVGLGLIGTGVLRSSDAEWDAAHAVVSAPAAAPHMSAA